MADYTYNAFPIAGARINQIDLLNEIDFEDISSMTGESSLVFDTEKAYGLGIDTPWSSLSSWLSDAKLEYNPTFAWSEESSLTLDAQYIPLIHLWNVYSDLEVTVFRYIDALITPVTSVSSVSCNAERIRNIWANSINMDGVNETREAFVNPGEPRKIVILKSVTGEADATTSYIGGTFDLISNIASAKIPTFVGISDIPKLDLTFWAGSSYALRIGKPTIFDITEGRIKIEYDAEL